MIIVSVLVTMIAAGGVVAFVAYHRAEILRLREENRRLREWQGAQGKAPELGGYRSIGVSYVHSSDQCERCTDLTRQLIEVVKDRR